MIDSEVRFLSNLPLNQTAAADALVQLAVDFNGFFVIGTDKNLIYHLRNAIAQAAAYGYSRMIIQVGVNLPDERVGMTEMGIDITITETQGCSIALVAAEPLATILREKGVELGSFKLGTTESLFIHPNTAFAEAKRKGWTSQLLTVGFPENGWFDIRRGEVNQDPYPYPVIVVDPVPPAAWKQYRVAAVIIAVGLLSIWLTGSKTIPTLIMTVFLYANYRSPWARGVILGTCMLSLIYFWME